MDPRTVGCRLHIDEFLLVVNDGKVGRQRNSGFPSIQLKSSLLYSMHIRLERELLGDPSHLI